MYYLKHIISRIFFPVSLCLELMLAGILLRRYTQHKRTGSMCLVFAFLVLLLLSMQPVSESLLCSSNGNYSAFKINSVVAGKSVAICVLGQNYSITSDIPPLQRFSAVFKNRIWEAMRINRMLLEHGFKPELWISIAGKVTVQEKARALPDLALLFQLDRNSLHMITSALDTEDEICLLRPHLHGKQVILVSDQNHLPRAIMLASAYGLNVIPAPTIGVSRQHYKKSLNLIPSARNLVKSEKAFYEILGRSWVWLKSKL